MSGVVDAKHKWNSPDRPFCIPNEVICSELGRFLGLPIPPYSVTHPHPIQLKDTTIKMFFSSIKIDFGRRDERPMMGQFCVEKLHRLSVGILMFDVLIANSDRHDINLVVDNLRSPRKIRVIDQDGALFGVPFPGISHGIERLRELKDRLGVTAGSKSGGNRHTLIDHFKTTEHFRWWCDRISEIPGRLIDRLCRESRAYGLSKAESDEATTFLRYRRDNIARIVSRHRHEFLGIESWSSL